MLGFQILLSFFLLVPFATYATSVLRNEQGLIGFYSLLFTSAFKLYTQTKAGFLHFFLYIASIHVLGFLPFLALILYVTTKNRFLNIALSSISNVDENFKSGIAEIENAVTSVKTAMPLKEKVEIRFFHKRNTQLSSFNCTVLRMKSTILLVFGARMPEAISKRVISIDELKAVICHEFGHVSNKDDFIPFATRVILNRWFLITLFIALTLFLQEGRYVLLPVGKRLNFLPYPLTLLITSFASLVAVGMGWRYASLCLQRCEVFADLVAVRYIPAHILKNAILKMSILAEKSSNSSFSFASESSFTDVKRHHILEVFRPFNIFSARGRLPYHPALSRRLKILDSSSSDIEEQQTGLLNFEIFGFVGVFTAGTAGILMGLTGNLLKSVAQQDLSVVAFSFTMYFLLVFLACFPLRYTKNEFKYDKKGIKLLTIYSVTVGIMSNIVPLINRWVFITNNLGRNVDWEGRMYLRTQISHSISSVISGIIFSMVLFLIFSSVANNTNKTRREQ
ncbi:MAG: M48 family metalloprotease [Candidatus Omnitrophota bacterium]